jgi:hypothetical protein
MVYGGAYVLAPIYTLAPEHSYREVFGFLLGLYRRMLTRAVAAGLDVDGYEQYGGRHMWMFLPGQEGVRPVFDKIHDRTVHDRANIRTSSHRMHVTDG